MRPPQSWRTARVTLFILILTVAAWLLIELFQLHATAVYGAFLPIEVSRPEVAGPVPVWLTPLTATLLHAGLLHLAMNMLMLGFCGRSVEGVIGPAGLAILYVLGAYVAAAGQYLADPDSLVQMVGASGAVSAVLGAYAMLFGRNRVRVENPTVALWLNALWLMAAWVGLQLLVGYVVGMYGLGMAVAAHIGGFLVGVLLARLLLLLRYRKA